MKKFILAILINALILAGCNPAASTPAAITHLQLPMGYIANVQFAPFYVAVEKGYFKQEGIDIQFDYRFETDGMKLVGAGTIPFAVVSGEQVPLARSQGLPVKYVMQWFQKFPIGVVALACECTFKVGDKTGEIRRQIVVVLHKNVCRLSVGILARLGAKHQKMRERKIDDEADRDRGHLRGPGRNKEKLDQAPHGSGICEEAHDLRQRETEVALEVQTAAGLGRERNGRVHHIGAAHGDGPGNRIGDDDRQTQVVIAKGKHAEIDDRIDDPHDRKTRRLERDGALVPSHRETIKEILEGRRNHRRARLARQNMAR